MRKRYLNENNENTENIELWIDDDKDGKIFCKFKTEKDAFPDPKYNSIIETIPIDGNFILHIFSQPRKFKEDNSKINLLVKNGTQLTLTIKIQNDDTENPRVRIDSQTTACKVQYLK